MTVEELAMNWWMLAGGLMALICMWHLITINFRAVGARPVRPGAYGRQDAVAWLIAAQFAGYSLSGPQ